MKYRRASAILKGPELTKRMQVVFAGRAGVVHRAAHGVVVIRWKDDWDGLMTLYRYTTVTKYWMEA